MTIDTEIIIERIRYMIKVMDTTATSFANEAGITPSVISHILNGRNKPTIDTLNSIIAAYPDWSYEWLLFGQGEPRLTSVKTQLSTIPSESDSINSLAMTRRSSLFDSDVLGEPSSRSPLEPSSINEVTYTKDLETSYGLQEAILTEFHAIRQQIEELKSTPDIEKVIDEIRIYYSDGSYDVFAEKKKFFK